MEIDTAQRKKLRESGLLIIGLFVLLGFSIYWNSLGNHFQYDDETIIVYNRNINSLKNLPRFFINPLMYTSDPNWATHYRPLVTVSYSIDYAISKLKPLPYHVTNIVFHVGSSFLIYLIVQLLIDIRTKPPLNNKTHIIIPLAAGLIFLVHPFNSEAVNYITARSSLMSGFFYLLAFYLWIRFRKSRSQVFFISSILAFTGGIMSKEVAVTLPIILWIYDIYFYKHRLQQGTTGTQGISNLLNWGNYLSYLPFVVIGIIPFIVVRLISFGNVLPSFQRNLMEQFFTELPVLVKHWQMFLFPVNLSIFHHIEIQKTFWSFQVISAFLILTVYIAVAFILVRKDSEIRRMVSFFMVWFFIVLLPTTVIPLNVIFQENRGYLAMVSFVVLSGTIIGVIQTRILNVAVVILVILIGIYSGATFYRNKIWKTELTLWSDTAIKAPHSQEVYTFLGVAYRRMGMYKQSLEASKKALELGGHNNFFIHDNLGRIYIEQGQLELAAHELREAIEIYPHKAPVHATLGSVYNKLGKLDLAEKELMEAMRLDPKLYGLYFYLGATYTKQGRLDDAIKAYEKTLSLYPGHMQARLFTGILLEKTGRWVEAAGYYNQIVEEGGHRDDAVVKDAQKRLKSLEAREKIKAQ